MCSRRRWSLVAARRLTPVRATCKEPPLSPPPGGRRPTDLKRRSSRGCFLRLRRHLPRSGSSRTARRRWRSWPDCRRLTSRRSSRNTVPIRPARPVPVAVRSRQVHRSCHQKLWSTASATASAVAGSYGQPTACVNSVSAPSWSTNPIAPTVTNRETRRVMRPSIHRPGPGAVPPHTAPSCCEPRSR